MKIKRFWNHDETLLDDEVVSWLNEMDKYDSFKIIQINNYSDTEFNHHHCVIYYEVGLIL